jgi:hypothetical protein
MVRPGRYAQRIDHFNVLRTLEDMYGLPALGKSANAAPITDIWTTDLPRPTIELVQDEPGCVLVVLESVVATRSGELGLAYDPQAVVPTGVAPAAGLPAGAAIRFDPGASNGCRPETRVDAGLTLAWTPPGAEDVLIPPGRHALVRICFGLPPGAFRGESHPLQFVDCLGAAESPVRNTVVDSTGKSLFVITRDGAVSVPGKPFFQRGDADGDGHVGVNDSITILESLFLSLAPVPCEDAADANDDNSVDIADPIAILFRLFFGGAALPPPGPDACGEDPTPGALLACTPVCP